MKTLLQRIPGRMPSRDELEADGKTWKKQTVKFLVKDDQGHIVFSAIYYVPVVFY